MIATLKWIKDIKMLHSIGYVFKEKRDIDFEIVDGSSFEDVLNGLKAEKLFYDDHKKIIYNGKNEEVVAIVKSDNEGDVEFTDYEAL